MSKAELKRRVIQAIDERADKIIDIGKIIWKNPELGYKEVKTSEFVKENYQEMDLSFEDDIAITGSKAYLGSVEKRPSIGIIGELDAVRCPDHPECDPVTGAVHACGHNAQIAAMLGAGFGLHYSGVLDKLVGNVVMLTVPAEEYLEIDFRNTLREKGEIAFFGGKQEFIHLGAMNDIDLCLGTHTEMDTERKLAVAGSNNGFIGKLIRYIGKEAHAGGSPHKGINALNAAFLGLMGIHAQRETFKDEDHIRVHPIITKGGEIVNNVPADVRMESYVRGKTIDAIKDANIKVNRALKAGAMAIGAEAEINDLPGYMPYHHNSVIDDIIQQNCYQVVGKNQVEYRGHSTGSTDMGDISCIMPTSSFGMGGVEGEGHSRTYKVVNPETQYVLPSKILALTCIDLLYNQAEEAERIIESFEPFITKENYTEFMFELVK